MDRDQLKGKQTKGEWHAPHLSTNDDGSGECQCQWVLNENYCGSICTVNWSPEGAPLEYGDNPPKEEAKANGMLIAEAGTAANRTGMWPKDMEARIKELETKLNDVIKWISVKERLPKIGQRVLATNGEWVAEVYYGGYGDATDYGIMFRSMTSGTGCQDVTDWKFLPNAPTK